MKITRITHRHRVLPAALLLGTALAAGWVLGPERATQQEQLASFIIQADRTHQLLLLAEQQGWQVTHRLDLINAIVVTASADLNAIEGVSDEIRVTPNHGLKTANAPRESRVIQTDATLKFDDERISLELSNTSVDDVLLESISLAWPAKNGKLKKVSIDGESEGVGGINQPSQAGRRSIDIPASLWGSDDRRLEGNRDTRFKFKFEGDAEGGDSDYDLVFFFADGTYKAFGDAGARSSDANSPESDSGATGTISEFLGQLVAEVNDYMRIEPFLNFFEDRATLAVRNTGWHRLEIESIDVCWPADNGALLSLTLDGQNVLSLGAEGHLAVAGTSNLGVTIPGDLLSDSRFIDNGDLVLGFEFSGTPLATPEAYQIAIHFVDGTGIEFTPGDGMLLQGFKRDTFHPTIVRADDLHRQAVTGSGVSIAFLDTGISGFLGLDKDSSDNRRLLATYNAITDQTGDSEWTVNDGFGHGTHVTSSAVLSDDSYDFSTGEPTGSYNGITSA